ncbi:MAG: NFACT family protein [Acetomicrobium sp.]
MRYGPELALAWTLDINERYKGKKLFRCEAGREWLALQFSRNNNWLWLSWDNQSCGMAVINKQELDILKELRAKTHPISGAIKSHLVGGFLVQAFQINRDRVIAIEFSRPLGAGVNVSRFLVFEATGRQANLIILDDKQKIMEVAKHIHPEINRYRSVLPGLFYTPPPPFEGPDLEIFSKNDLANITKYRGIGQPLAKFLLKEWELRNLDLEPYLKGLYSITLQELICQEIDDYLTAFPLPLSGSRGEGKSPLESSKKLLDQYFERERHKMLEQIYKILDVKRHKIINKIKGLSALLSNVEEAEKWSHYGTLLISYAHKVKDGAPFACLKSWDERYGRVEIKLDPKLSPIENAKKYFKLAKKYQRNEEKLSKEMEKLKNALNELDEYREFVSMLNDVSDVKKILDDLSSDVRSKGSRKSGDYVPPYKRLDLKDGFIVYVGLNAKGNRHVTFKIASPEDLWFHAKDVTGAHVILKLSGKPANEKLINFAASLAAYYSKAKEASYHVVDYTQRKHVKSLPKTGPGHVTYSDFSSTRVSPGLWLELLEELQ